MTYFDGWQTETQELISYRDEKGNIYSQDAITLHNMNMSKDSLMSLDFKKQVEKVIDLHKEYHISPFKLKRFINNVKKFERNFIISGEEVKLKI